MRLPIKHLPPGIWALGFVSLFMDISSELVHSLLPVYMATVLGASMVTIGIIEGVAEATAAIVKVFSGTLSDLMRRRKPLALLGYGLAAFTKPLFPLAGSIAWVFTARFADRIGKGIRGAPRDALVADITPPGLRGAAYGLRQALDSVGAFLGPLLAIVFMVLLAGDARAVLWIAVVPAFISVAILLFGVHEAGNGGRPAARAPVRLAAIPEMGPAYWKVVALGAVFTLARFSEAFLVLRAESVGVTMTYVPVVMVVMSIAYAVTAYPAGAASDRMSRRKLLLLGLAVLIAADIILARADTFVAVLAGAALWGVHMGLTQGLLSKLVADTAPVALRGTGFGLFSMVSGIALLLASLLAGGLWQLYGAPATFVAGACFAGLACLGLLASLRGSTRA